ncbi:DNA polymerase III subunit [bacterium]|nr:DNA polymerase III subunit [bacterium]
MVGHQKIIKLLSRSIEKNKVAQAYLFSGPEGVGKFTLAEKFAKSLISGKKFTILHNMVKDESAGKRGENKKFLSDLIILKPEVEEKKEVTKEREIKIERIREVQKEMSLFPSQGNYRALIIDNAHKMNKASQNALLKTIEETNETSIIILVTHEEGKLLPTVKSRCQKIRFNLVADGEIEELLNDPEFLSKDLISKDKIISFSAGRPGWAVKIARNKKELHSRESALKELKKISAMNIAQRMEMAEKFSKNIPEAIKKLEFWVWIMHSGAIKDFKNASRFFKIIEKLEDSMEKLKNTNANGRLALENLIMNL